MIARERYAAARQRTLVRVSMQAAPADVSDLGDGIAQIRLPMTGNPLRYINGYVRRRRRRA